MCYMIRSSVTRGRMQRRLLTYVCSLGILFTTSVMGQQESTPSDWIRMDVPNEKDGRAEEGSSADSGGCDPFEILRPVTVSCPPSSGTWSFSFTVKNTSFFSPHYLDEIKVCWTSATEPQRCATIGRRWFVNREERTFTANTQIRSSEFCGPDFDICITLRDCDNGCCTPDQLCVPKWCPRPGASCRG